MAARLTVLITRILQTDDGEALATAMDLWERLEDDPVVADTLSAWAELNRLELEWGD